MPFGLEPSQLLLFAILIGAILLLFTEWIRIDLTAILIILALSFTGLLEPDEAFSGFGSEPAIMLASIFVISGAWQKTGLSEQLGNLIKSMAGTSFERIIVILMPSVALLSAFTGHVALTAIMLPVTLTLARENEIQPSKLLMPMSFAASLGSTIAIIGAPAFLVANGLLKQSGQPGLEIFSIAPIGLALTLAGTLFVLVTGNFLLPANESDDESMSSLRLQGYYTEMVILPDSKLIGNTIKQIETELKPNLRVAAWFRDKRPRNKPFGNKRVKSEDVLVIRTDPDKLVTIQERPGIALYPLHKYEKEFLLTSGHENNNGEDISSRLVQSIVAPKSELSGKTIGQIDFLRRYKVIIVGVWRKKGWLRTELSRTRLRGGDILVMVGNNSSLKQIAEDQSFLMLVPFDGEPNFQHKAYIAGAITLLTILTSVLNLIPVDVAFLGGAAAMLLFKCISIRQAYQSIDTRIYVFIAGAIPLGLAMQKTGTASLLGRWLQVLVSDWGMAWILLVFFLAAGIITQVMSDTATTILLAPIAIALARGLNLPPEPFVVTIAMASVASFFTPIGHHGNLLIYGPGRYHFTDFLRVGIPLTFLAAAIVVIIAPMLWPAK